MPSHQKRQFRLTVLAVGLVGCLSGILPNASIASDRYIKQKQEMSEYIYPLYRMLERFMQTTKFSQGISITSRAIGRCSEDDKACEYASNLPQVSKQDNLLIWALQTINDIWGGNQAYASSSNNLIVISRSIQNNLTSNTKGLACVVAHEAAHIEKNHSKQQRQHAAGLDKIASQKIDSAVANAYKAKKGQEFWADFAYNLNTSIAEQQYSQGNYASAWQSHASAQNLRNQIAADLEAGSLSAQTYANFISEHLGRLGVSAPKTISSMQSMQGLPINLVERTIKDVRDYVVDFAVEIKKMSRDHEKEADRLAVQYMASAGLNPESCIEVIELIHRNTPDSSTGEFATHPGENERLNAMRQAIQDLPPRMKRKYKNVGPSFKYPLLPYVYDSETEVVRLSLPGTSDMTQGANDRKSVADSIFGD